MAANGHFSYNVSYPVYLGAQYDASSTNLSYLIPAQDSTTTPALELTLSFLSPITPTSTLRQAIPAAYFNFYVKGNVPVDIYVDLNGQWVSGDRGSPIMWEFTQQNFGSGRNGLKTWKVKRQTEQLLTEFLDRAEWGSLHFTAPLVCVA